MLFHAWSHDNSCTITIKCYQISFTGIYDEPSCNPNNLSHAVLLVGYGSEGGQDYWIIKNRSEKTWCIEKSEAFLLLYLTCTSVSYIISCFLLFSWGSSWGEGGYMRIIRDGRNVCGIASYALYPVLWFWWDALVRMLNSYTELPVGLRKQYHS